jgi:hypothetical protein
MKQSDIAQKTAQPAAVQQQDTVQAYRGASLESPQAAQLTQIADLAEGSPASTAQRRLSAMARDGASAAATPPTTQASHSGGGLPAQLKSGIEALSGISMDNVRVHYNSSKPAQLQALAYAQGSDIHVGPGQEKHLPHEAWHVVQQAQGRVRPTVQAKGMPINDNPSLEREADVMGARAMRLNVSEGVLLRKSMSSTSTAQFLMDEDVFKKGTSLGVFNRREGILRKIDKMLHKLHAIRGSSGGRGGIGEEIECLNIIESLADIWIVSHSGQDAGEIKALDVVKVLLEEIRLDQNNLFKGLAADDPRRSLGMEKVAKYREKFEGSVSGAFDRLGGIFDLIVPSSGTKAECELEIKVPVYPHIFVGGVIKAEAERGDGSLKVRSDIYLTLGASAGVLELKGSAGGYIEAQAVDARGSVELMSYGLYRRLSSSKKFPRDVVSIMWGGDTGATGRAMSDNWAGNVQSRLLNTESSYVETGGLLGVSAKASLGVADVEGGVSVSKGKRYSGRTGGGRALFAPEKMYATNKKFEADATLLGLGVSYKKIEKNERLWKKEFEGEVKANFPVGTVWREFIGVGTRILNVVKRKNDAEPTVGGFVDAGGGVGAIIVGLNSIEDRGVSSVPGVHSPVEVSGSSGSGSMVVKMAASREIGKSWEIELTANASENLNVSAGVVGFKLKKVTRVVGTKYSNNRWVRL